MSGSTLGHIFKLTCFGESHGPAIGGILDGCPAGLALSGEAVQQELDRRRPGQSAITTQRKELDEVGFLSGIFEGKTTGAPIGFIIHNSNQKSSDYEHLKEAFRPSHADYTYHSKYGIRDHNGGGRSSARATAAWVVGGAIAKQFLAASGVEIRAWVSGVGSVKLNQPYTDLNLDQVENNDVRCPDSTVARQMEDLIREVRKAGDTVGGVVSAVITGVPVGLGMPLFGKLHADIGHAMLSINAVKGFEFGSGFSGTEMRGSQHNDLFQKTGKGIRTVTNHSGGIQGGISNGEDIYFNVAFKPVATIMQPQQSVDKDGNEAVVEGKGRHDPCVVPRAVPIVEAMAAMVMTDHILLSRTTNL